MNSPVYPPCFLDINFSIDFIFLACFKSSDRSHNIGFIISHFLTTFSFCLLCLILSLKQTHPWRLHIIKFLSRIQVITRSLLITQIIQLSIIITSIASTSLSLFASRSSAICCVIKTIQSIVYRFHGCGYDGFIPPELAAPLSHHG